jgi:WD40 repeat protein
MPDALRGRVVEQAVAGTVTWGNLSIGLAVYPKASFPRIVFSSFGLPDALAYLTPCQAGKYSAAGASVCSDCEAGKYSATAASTVCTNCASGTYSGSTASTCTSCPTLSNSLAGSTNCECIAGHTGSNGGPCTACAAGKYKSAVGTGTCADCGAGTYSETQGATTANTCLNCAAGKYSATVGAALTSTCMDCGAGTFRAAAVLTWNPPEASRTYSTVNQNDTVGTGHAQSMLDSAQAWSAGLLSAGSQWMKIDLGDPMRVRGVVIQGRDSSQYVTEVEVQHSLHPNSGSSGLQWQANGGVRAFPTATNNQKSELLFMEPVVARYIKIVVWGWNKYISMRAGVLVDEPAVSCLECPVNTHNAYTGATVCTDCPPSTSSLKIGASSSLVCKCMFSATRSCRSCPANQYGLGPSDRKVGTLMPRGWKGWYALAQGQEYVSNYNDYFVTSPDGNRTVTTGAFQPNDIDMTHPLPGNIAVITNWGNGQVMYMNISTGDITPVNWGGQGFAIGAASQAKFYYPQAAVASPDGSMILVAGNIAYRVLKIALPDGAVSVFAGPPAELGCCDGINFNRDGNRSFARFQGPSDVAFHPDGNRIFVADTYIRLIDLAADHVSTISVSASKFAITKDGSTLVFIDGNIIRAMDVTLPGSYPVRHVAGIVYSGYADGVGTSAKFSSPTGITITPDGATAFVVENYAIRSVDMKTGAVSTLAGSGTQRGYLDGYGLSARFGGGGGLALTPDGSILLVSETGGRWAPCSLLLCSTMYSMFSFLKKGTLLL